MIDKFSTEATPLKGQLKEEVDRRFRIILQNSLRDSVPSKLRLPNFNEDIDNEIDDVIIKQYAYMFSISEDHESRINILTSKVSLIESELVDAKNRITILETQIAKIGA